MTLQAQSHELLLTELLMMDLPPAFLFSQSVAQFGEM
jgi:hypothetical protein